MPDGWENPADDQLVQRVPHHFPTNHTIMPKNPNFPRPIQPPVIIKPVRKIKKVTYGIFVRSLNAMRSGLCLHRQRHTSINRLLGSLPRGELAVILSRVS